MPACPIVGDLVLKWPNDMLVGRAKLAGILLEREGDAIIVGIGVNIAVHPDVEGQTGNQFARLGSERTHC